MWSIDSFLRSQRLRSSDDLLNLFTCERWSNPLLSISLMLIIKFLQSDGETATLFRPWQTSARLQRSPVEYNVTVTVGGLEEELLGLTQPLLSTEMD